MVLLTEEEMEKIKKAIYTRDFLETMSKKEDMIGLVSKAIIEGVDEGFTKLEETLKELCKKGADDVEISEELVSEEEGQ